MTVFDRLHMWHQTKTGLLVFGLIELVGAYIFASWAIDSGSLIDWLLTVVLLIGALQNFVRFGLGMFRASKKS